MKLATAISTFVTVPPVVVPVVLVGCAPHSTQREPGLTYQSLADGGLAVMGVWHEVGEDSVASDRLAALAWSSVVRARPELDVMPPFSLAQQLEPEPYAALLRRLSEGAPLDATDIREVDRPLAGRRYLLVGRVEGDELRSVVEASMICDEENRDSELYSVERFVTVRYLIHDVAAGTVVWSRSANRKARISNLRLGACDPLWVDLLEFLISEEEARPGTPAPPDRWQIFGDVFEELSKMLPVPSR